MTLVRSLTVSLVVALASPATHSTAAPSPMAADPRSDSPAPPTPTGRVPVPHLRSTDTHLLKRIRQAAASSPTLRALIDRLEHSDVVVYLYCDGDPRSRVAGRLTFLTAAAGWRYVIVRLAPQRQRALQMAVLGHELQHAVEIADTPSIVDGPSLAREYLRIGHVNQRDDSAGIAFDTNAAVDTGRQVLAEILGIAGDKNAVIAAP